MSFISKILDAFKMESAREIENGADRPASQANILYHDRFHEEYRKINTYREISFSGKSLNYPEVQICMVLLLNQSRKGYTINRNDEYSRYYEGKYGIKNINKLHKWLYDNGYLRNAYLDEALNLYKVPELKMILESLGLQKTGKKADLIERITESISDSEKDKITKNCNTLFLSDEGEMFLEENYDFVLFHRCQYNISIEEFLKNRIVGNRKRNFNDTVFQILSQRAYVYQIIKYYSQLEMIYHNMSNICYEDEKKDLALQYEVYRMYFSANLSTRTYLFDKDFVKVNGVENLKSRIDSPTVFNQYMLKRIFELKSYFTEQMLDVVYTPEILPYCLFSKYDMLDAILDLYERKFDAEFYTNYIRINYGKYIKNFL